MAKRALDVSKEQRHNEIVEKRQLAPSLVMWKLYVPDIAKRVKPGQFVVLRADDTGERIPLTVADFDREKGQITVIFQEVGASTKKLSRLDAGGIVLDVVGPLGKASHIEKFGTVVCVGGGVGVAPVYPIAKALYQAGNKIFSIIGARNKEMLILEDEMRAISNELLVTTDDGSYGRHGFVTDELTRLIQEGNQIDLVLAIGPVVMMRAVAEVTRPYNLKTVVSLNSIMIDGTGMCGGCRTTVGDETKFVCVDGPEFDAHQVNFKELMLAPADVRQGRAARHVGPPVQAGGPGGGEEEQEAGEDAGAGTEAEDSELQRGGAWATRGKTRSGRLRAARHARNPPVSRAALSTSRSPNS